MAPSVVSQQNHQVISPPVSKQAPSFALATSPSLSAGTSLAQTLGPWELSPPTSATLISGGGPIFGWLNTSNSALSLSAAMASSPIENGAFANADIGTIVEVSFAGGVVNGPGADLVMLDAQFDVGDYAISSDFDGFASSVVVSTSFGISVANIGYFYEFNPAGPFSASAVGIEIDLSSIGVPAGGMVNSLRFNCVNGSCDPISLAKIDSGFSLSVSTLTAGSLGTFDATGGTPSGNIGIGFSLAGNTPTLVNAGACGVLMVDLAPPIQVLTTLPADMSGNLNFSVTIPANATGTTVHFQALDFGSCELSNGVTTTVL